MRCRRHVVKIWNYTSRHFHLLLIALCRASERTPHITRRILVDDILHTRIRAASQHQNSNQEDDRIEHAQARVLQPIIPLALLYQLEPEKRGEVEREARDEERGDETEECVEEWNSLCNDPSEDCDDGDQADPYGPAFLALYETDGVVGERAVHEVASHDCAVDRARDEDDGKCNAECNPAHGIACGQKSWRLDILSDESVDEPTGHGVDEDFDETKCPDGFDVVLWRVHLGHEAELADGEGVGKDDVGGGQERFVESGLCGWPCGPVDAAQAAGSVVCLHAGCDNGDDNGCDDGYEIDVAQDSKLGECWR